MKICGEGEWKVKVHGRSSRRKWIKIHLAIDADTQEIVAEITTVSSVGDSKLTGLLLDQIPISPKKF
ncbi:MAG: transposase [Parachlamydiaceae bacterium]|nr:MAG: transposase [Parachlamydiaceae bacterium]